MPLHGDRSLTSLIVLALPFLKFWRDAEVHDYGQPCATGFLGGSFVHNAFLHPHRSCADADRGVNDFENEFGAPKNIYNVNFFPGNVLQTGVTLLCSRTSNSFGFTGMMR